MQRKVFAVLVLGALMVLFASPALAQEAAGAVSKVKDYAVFAAALGMGLATFGGALGQGRTASSALEGIARNPGAAGSMFTPMILGLVLIESLVIYSLVVEILIVLFNR
ncbi:MAG TPA: ATP synthase F0 subunit C [bacterium]|nr:ATP synthase F0 subunit C [bacterium]